MKHPNTFWFTQWSSELSSLSFTEKIYWKTDSSIIKDRLSTVNEEFICVNRLTHNKRQAKKKTKKTHKQQSVVGPMTILPGSLSIFERRRKTVATRRRPVVPSQRRSAGQFSVIISDFGCRRRDVTCRVTSLCKLLAKICKISGFTRNSFLALTRHIAHSF